MTETEYLKAQIEQLKYTIQELREENKLLTGINITMKHEIAPLEEFYYKHANGHSRKRDASFKNIINQAARILRKHYG